MDIDSYSYSLSLRQRTIKRTFDFVLASVGLVALWWLIIIAWVIASKSTSSNGFFTQTRVGQHGRLFSVVKIKTMKPSTVLTTTVTRAGDPRITRAGRFFRRTKIDELPQLWNVFIGDMSFVGPRPDVPGYADTLLGAERSVLSLRPGITGPATIKYRDEEEILVRQSDPEVYNREVIFPDKVQENINYIRNWSLIKDIGFILKTVFTK